MTQSDQHPFDGAGYGVGPGVRGQTRMGWAHTLGSVGEYGRSEAADTELWIDPAEDRIALYLGRCMPPQLFPARRQFKGLAYQALVE